MLRQTCYVLILVLVSLPVMADSVTEHSLRTDIYLKPHSWLRHQAEMGDPHSQFNLAYLYYMSGTDPAVTGIIHSNKLAARWYRKAAQQGHSGAQFNMAALYINGDGVDRDPVAAYGWLNLAAEQGHTRSVELLDTLASVLNDEQIDAATAQSWQVRQR
jgi:TPR repeat protein